MYDQMNGSGDYRQQPEVMMIPPSVIERYINQWITTYIPGFGRVVAYVLDFNPRTGMVSLQVYPRRGRQGQFVQVHYSDMVGISPYFGPVPPHHGHHHHHGPGHGPGGFWPWLWQSLF
ncbi:hypothetical protein B0H94_102176 [Salsuginibacillus halophilus]|uniref:Uncharacterized protein n=1 Tax=Salsuginibacillus halophilus TaxID=517424 RepID=A0A2P8HXD9_9BACI|nr:hypothetical protein [Salsuginibacillus halophilus]PSL50899.1 hypothetical protein B0H94_102176 [Salsuginibacillus halophilus]